MTTNPTFIEDDLAEIEKILEIEWVVEEDNFKSLLNGIDKTSVY